MSTSRVVDNTFGNYILSIAIPIAYLSAEMLKLRGQTGLGALWPQPQNFGLGLEINFHVVMKPDVLLRITYLAKPPTVRCQQSSNLETTPELPASVSSHQLEQFPFDVAAESQQLAQLYCYLLLQSLFVLCTSDRYLDVYGKRQKIGP